MAKPQSDLKVIDDLPDEIPVTEDELALVETYLDKIIAEMLNDA
ncbi:MAG: hypothetical protein R8J41_11290 [Alphaproteobacteria bacterium]|nr:hypothetical protein [Alphaproteobacteria bacterium]